jgi:hypothetical protein
MMGASSTARSRHFRQRKRAGKVQLTIEIDEAGLEVLLAHHGLVPACGSDDRNAVVHALEQLLQLLIAADAAQHNQ